VVQNLDDTEPLWVCLTGAASAGPGSLELAAGGGGFVWEALFIPSGAVSVFAATTSHPFTCIEG
jgi:hypothetical protein